LIDGLALFYSNTLQNDAPASPAESRLVIGARSLTATQDELGGLRHELRDLVRRGHVPPEKEAEIKEGNNQPDLIEDLPKIHSHLKAYWKVVETLQSVELDQAKLLTTEEREELNTITTKLVLAYSGISG
jgi:hypothetical protein